MSTLEALSLEASTCVKCVLSSSRTNVVFGVGDPHAQLMFIGEGPGRDEDLLGEPFVGRSGRLLDRLITEELELLRSQCYIANVVKCRPPNNRTPLPDEAAACRCYLDGQLEAVKPDVVVSLGNSATQSLLQTTEGVTRLRGKVYPFQQGVLVPTYHPAYALRAGAMVLAQMRADFVRAKQVLKSVNNT